MEEPVVYFRRLESNKLENVIKYSFYEELKKENLELKEKLKKAIEQDYCTICGRILNQCKP